MLTRVERRLVVAAHDVATDLHRDGPRRKQHLLHEGGQLFPATDANRGGPLAAMLRDGAIPRWAANSCPTHFYRIGRAREINAGVAGSAWSHS